MRKHSGLTGGWRLGDLKQDCARLQVTDLESCEVNVVHIVLWTTQVVCGTLAG